MPGRFSSGRTFNTVATRDRVFRMRTTTRATRWRRCSRPVGSRSGSTGTSPWHAWHGLSAAFCPSRRFCSCAAGGHVSAAGASVAGLTIRHERGAGRTAFCSSMRPRTKSILVSLRNQRGAVVIQTTVSGRVIPTYLSCAMESTLPSLSLNHATMSPFGNVAMQASSWNGIHS